MASQVKVKKKNYYKIYYYFEEKNKKNKKKKHTSNCLRLVSCAGWCEPPFSN